MSNTAELCPKVILAKGRRSDPEWTKFKTMTLDCLPIMKDPSMIFEPHHGLYGGRLDLPQEEATGFFYVKQVPMFDDDDNTNNIFDKSSSGDNPPQKWVMVDPEGHRFVCMGINSVSPQAKDKLYKPAFQSVFRGNTHAWAVQARALLFQRLGFTSLGRWSEANLFNNDDNEEDLRVPYCTKLNFMLGYKNVRPGGKYDIWRNPLPVFDPEFEAYCKEDAKQLVATKDDPWLLGHFSDNELPFHERDLLNRYLNLPETDPGHLAALEWLNEHNKERKDITRNDHSAFAEVVVGRYYRIVSEAIKSNDPNHMFLGTRFHGKVCNQDCTFSGSAPYLDVITVNYYHRWTPEQDRINSWCQELSQPNRPFMVTEFYAKGEDSEDQDNITNESGSGYHCQTQADRGAFYENFVLNLLRNPNVVGWHWFRYSDYASNMGIVNSKYQPYQDLATSMQRINTRVYSLSDYLLEKTYALMHGSEDDKRVFSKLFMDKQEIVEDSDQEL